MIYSPAYLLLLRKSPFYAAKPRQTTDFFHMQFSASPIIVPPQPHHMRVHNLPVTTLLPARPVDETNKAQQENFANTTTRYPHVSDASIHAKQHSQQLHLLEVSAPEDKYPALFHANETKTGFLPTVLHNRSVCCLFPLYFVQMHSFFPPADIF